SSHTCGGIVLWSARGHDVASRRPVRLLARSVFASVGIFVWVGAVSGNPDGNYCGIVNRVLAISRCVVAEDFGEQLPCSSNPYFARLCSVALNRAADRIERNRISHLDEHERSEVRQRRAERVHVDEDRIATGSNRYWGSYWMAIGGGDG